MQWWKGVDRAIDPLAIARKLWLQFHGVPASTEPM